MHHGKMRGSVWNCVLLLAIALVCTESALGEDGGWRVVSHERGILVTARDQKGRDLPTFRGQGTIAGNVLHVLAVVLDANRASKWARGADQAAMLRQIDARTHVVYTRTTTPWPISDRDIVMRRVIRVLRPGAEFRIDLSCAPKERPVISGVIRVRSCESYFLLRKVDPQRTFVDYQIHLDPGGSIPDWFVRWASKRVPFDTLTRLERQVKRTAGQYDSTMRVWENAR